MTMLKPPARAALLAAALFLPALAWAEEPAPRTTTSQQVRTEISQAFDAVGSYAVQERDQAQAHARKAMARLDTEIERRQEALREAWGEMDVTARDRARATLRDLQQARNRLGERYGALESGADSAWDGLRAGFSNAYADLKRIWVRDDADNGPATTGTDK